MKSPLKGIILALSLLPATVVAEGKGKGNQDWAEKAALGYEEKAKVAKEAAVAALSVPLISVLVVTVETVPTTFPVISPTISIV